LTETGLAELSFDFAVSLLKLTDSILGQHTVVDQLERSGASIGANIRGAEYADNRSDYISLLRDALKNCNETEYWLELLEKTGLIYEGGAAPLLHNCGFLRRGLTDSIRQAKYTSK